MTLEILGHCARKLNSLMNFTSVDAQLDHQVARVADGKSLYHLGLIFGATVLNNYFDFHVTVSQNLKSHMNEGQRLNYILDRSLNDSKMIEGEKSIFYRPVF